MDDGNDAITGINLYHLNEDGTDGDKNFSYTVDVDENHAGEVNLGRVTVDDLDSPDHTNGRHDVTVIGPQAKNFYIKKDAEGGLWLVKRAGLSLDHEDNSFVTVTIQAADKDGEKYPPTHPVAAQRGKFTVEPTRQDVTVDINDQDDDPVTNVARGKAGWWVTVNEDLDAEDVDEGQWLRFNLQTSGVNAAFKDEDDDTPTYKIDVLDGPDFLEINKEGGIQNKEKMLPPEDGGVFNVRVTAEYKDKSPVHFDFQLTVAFSGANDEDNDAPSLKSASTRDYREGDGAGMVVATFTVEDDDSHLTGHPFAPGMPVITSVVNADNLTNDDNNDQSISRATPAEGYGSVFEIKATGTPNTYQIVTKENPLTKDVDETDTFLNHELAAELRITIAVSDGAGESDTLNIDIDIDDVEEAPEYTEDDDPNGSGARKEFPVDQFIEDDTSIEKEADQGKVALWIKLYDAWEDEDDNDDDNDLTFGATSNVPWVKILHGPAKWEDIRDGDDGDPGGGDDVTWAGGAGTTTPDVVWGENTAEPTDGDDWVVVVEIDRSKANNRQSDVTIDLGQGRTAGGGTFTLTATDDDGRTGTQPIYVSVTDENLDADMSKAVTISGTPREGRALVANFDETQDPDLAGGASPALVVYTWSALAAGADDGDEGAVRQVGASNRYVPTQDDVGMKIKVSVTYYEMVPAAEEPAVGMRGVLVLDDEPQNGGFKTTGSSTVSNSQNPGTVHINIRTNDANNGLTAEIAPAADDDDGIEATDDGNADNGTPLVYTWEKSVNGQGGWSEAEDADRSDTELSLADGDGQYYRLVVTYIDQGGFQERHVSHTIKVGELKDADPDNAPTLNATGQNQVGGILQVDDVPTGASVQWQMQQRGAWVNIDGAEGASLNVSADHAAAIVRAVVTSTDKDGVVDKDFTEPTTIGARPNTAPSKVKDYTVDDQVDDAGNFTRVHKADIDLSALFNDLNGDRLTYSVTAFSGSGVTDRSTTGDSGNAEFSAGSDNHVVSFKVNGSTGTLTYVTDLKGGHDGSGVSAPNDGNDPNDGTGNWVSFTVMADDNPRVTGGEASAQVRVRLNVKPSGIDDEEVVVDGVGQYTQKEGTFTKDTHIADLDVVDENWSGNSGAPGHPYGSHEVEVSDDRFGIRHTTGSDPKKDGDGDGSTWELYIKKEAAFDFDSAKDANPATLEKEVQIKLTITATDGGGKIVVKKDLITIIITRDGGDPQNPPTGDNVPGLSDNENPDDNGDKLDGAGDDDTDGGWTPPPPGMSVGGLIGDFIDTMDGAGQDVFDDFMLVIDDGLDIA